MDTFSFEKQSVPNSPIWTLQSYHRAVVEPLGMAVQNKSVCLVLELISSPTRK